jgi:tetratricopeptide (TPR) repeat protein
MTPLDFGHIRRAIELALRLGEPDAARRAADALLRYFPDAVAPVVLLGQALLDSGAPREAVAQFRQALKLNPLDAVAWGGLAGALARCGQRAASSAALLRAALHDPLGSEALAPGIAQTPTALGMGVVYLRRGHAALAAPELAAALNRQPGRDDLRIYSIEALRRAGDLAEARRLLAGSNPADDPSLPFLLLQAALTPEPQTSAALRERCARYDPDGQIARRFFAPDSAPWPLPTAPRVPSDQDLEAIMAYLPHAAAGPKSAANDQRPTTNDKETRRQGDKETEITHHASRITHHGPTIDPDVSAVVATTERLRQRLADVGGSPRPLVPWSGERDHTQILLSHRGALVRRYGEAGFGAIDRRLHALAAALRRRGIRTHCCYSDDASSLQIGDGIALAPVAQDATAVRELLRTLASGLAARRRQISTLLLIGGDDVVPFHRLPNPLADGDEAVLSDNPYGTDDAGYLLPQWVVARIPDSSFDSGAEAAHADAAPLLLLLDQIVESHQRGQRASSPAATGILGMRRGAAPAQAFAAGYSAEVWRETSRMVLDAIQPDARLVCSPPLDADAYQIEARDSRLLYVNLHGAAGLPNWYGQPGASEYGAAEQLPVALCPDYFARATLAGGLLISEACYGLDLAGRTARTSIPLCALAGGASAVVGATVNAYGSVAAPLLGADLLCRQLLAQLQRGVPVGEALRAARLEFAQTMYRRQGYLDDVDIKTLAEFVLLGDPWAGAMVAAAAPPPWPLTKLASIERVPKPRPKIALLEEQISRDLVQRARAALKRILPGAAAQPLRITAQPNPRRIRKGEAEQELVFSAQASHPTADGYRIAQTAHITFSGRAVVKVALTR